MTGKLVRFPLRTVAAVLVCKERGGDGWLALAGLHGWSFGTLAEARNEARWLAGNLNVPVREIFWGAK
jgi:hypothetical protein